MTARAKPLTDGLSYRYNCFGGVQMNISSRVLVVGLVAAIFSLPAATGRAQTYPAKPVRILVGLAAGGSQDLISRQVGAAAGERLGQSFVVENRPGQGTIPALEACARAQPDGYTLCMISSSSTYLPFLYAKLSFDPRKDFAPITNAVYLYEVLMVIPSLPVKSLQELVAYSKANPGKVNYGSLGVGSPQHMLFEWLKKQTGIDVTHIPYKGSPPIVQSFMSGDVQLVYLALPSWLEFIRAGKARPLLVSAKTRIALLPDVPALPETGLPDAVPITWHGFASPAGTPRPILARLSTSFGEVLRAPAMRDKLLDQGYQPIGNTPEEFAKFLAEDSVRAENMVRISGARFE